jgi:O-antigen/teichoic acid export membrane protein
MTGASNSAGRGRLATWLSVNRKHLRTLGGLSTAQVAVLVCGLATSVLLARFFPIETFGRYQVVLAWVGLITPLCLSGLGESVKLSAARRRDGNLRTIVTLVAGVCALGAVLLAAAAAWYWAEKPALAGGLLVAALLFPLTRWQSVWVNWRTARGELGPLARLQSVQALIGLVPVALLALLADPPLALLVGLALGLPAAFNLWQLARVWRSRANEERDGELIRYGLHVSLAVVLQGLILSDRILLESLTTPAVVAVYAIALAFPNQLKVVYNVLNTFFARSFYAAKTLPDAWQAFRRSLPLILVGSALTRPGRFPAAAAGHPAALLGPKYADAVPYSKWLWLSMSLTSVGSFLQYMLRGQRDTVSLYATSFGYPLVMFGLFWLLLSRGVLGLVIARIATQWLQALFLVAYFAYFLRRQTPAPAPAEVTG